MKNKLKYFYIFCLAFSSFSLGVSCGRCGREKLTPVTVNDAFDNLVEEIGDVRLLLRVTDFMYDGIPTQDMEEYKLQRWENRIKLGDPKALRL